MARLCSIVNGYKQNGHSCVQLLWKNKTKQNKKYSIWKFVADGSFGLNKLSMGTNSISLSIKKGPNTSTNANDETSGGTVGGNNIPMTPINTPPEIPKCSRKIFARGTTGNFLAILLWCTLIHTTMLCTSLHTIYCWTSHWHQSI